MADVTVHGSCEAQFEPVREAFLENFRADNDLGASVCVTRDGETVVDLWAGDRDQHGNPWEEDTIINVWSTTKTMSFLCGLLLADRGELDFEAKVASVWPEFAANGKQDVQIKHFFSHSAGLSGLQERVSMETSFDHEKMVELLAAQAPWWEPGTATGYHAITQGYLIGEVVRRITGQSLGTFFRKEIAEPLGADFHIGLAESEFGRVATLVPPPAPAGDDLAGPDPNSIAARTMMSPPVDATAAQLPGWRKAEIPAANGHGNARSVARVQSVMACGGQVGDVRLLSEAGCRKALEVQFDSETPDLVLGVPIKFGLGYGMASEWMPISPNPNCGWWGGYGGSTIVFDMDARVSFSYVMNRMEAGALGDPRGGRINRAVYESLGAL